jgi:hypothetical protein
VQNAIKKIDAKATKGLSAELDTSSINIQKMAARTAPGNLGKLKGSFNIDIGNSLFKSVFSTVQYAPYVEFGTRGKARIPAGFEAFAAQYKTSGKGAKGAWEAIDFWIKRNGIDPKFTFVIFRSIMRNGIAPQPFMIPSYEKEKPELLKRLKALFT